jgi:ubiquinone/menaquinone biosynthesis C-methylase UbiE
MARLDRARWEDLSSIGLTGHPGGRSATEQLASMCILQPGQRILVVGCGAGHTACYLAAEWRVRAIAFDFAFGMVRWTQYRALRKGVGKDVFCLQADAHMLPFPDNVFDGIFAESVTVLLNKKRAIDEYLRVTKPGGFVADNEPTWKAAPPLSLLKVAQHRLRNSPDHVYALCAEEWRAVYERAGLQKVQVVVRPYALKTILRDFVRIEGVAIGQSIIRTLMVPGILRSFFDPGSWRYRRGTRWLAAGLIVGRKE